MCLTIKKGPINNATVVNYMYFMNHDRVPRARPSDVTLSRHTGMGILRNMTAGDTKVTSIPQK